MAHSSGAAAPISIPDLIDAAESVIELAELLARLIAEPTHDGLAQARNICSTIKNDLEVAA